MSAINPPVSLGAPVHEPQAPGDNYLTHSRGILSWLFTLDHKRIGIMYMVGVLTAFFIGGVFAMLLRTELLTPGPTFNSDKTQAWNFYNHVFTLHGAVMVFLFIIPAIPAILGNFILPMQLGAKDVAFPRLNLGSLWCWIGGAIFFGYVLLGGILNASLGWHLPGGYGLDTGWTFYTPYSSQQASDGTIAALLGVFILGFSSILTGVNFIASIHMLRPKGMTWFRMPLFLWALYATSVIQILATPVLAITGLLLLAERLLHIGIFDSKFGGDPVLFQHFFWFYSHPAVYIMILPAMGVISEVISTHSRKHVFGYNFIAYSSIAIALLSFLVWGHHMFVSGQSPISNVIFSLLTFSVAVPSAIKVFNWVSTMYKGDIRFTPAMVAAMCFLVLFTFGGLTGLFLGSIANDIHVTGTYFIVAHFHYVMVGSVLFAFLAGLYHWWPKMFGRMVNVAWGNVGMILLLIGFNVTFFPQFIMGAKGMPRRYATYPVEFTGFHQVSTYGAYLMAIGLFTIAFNLLHALLKGVKAPANPWGSNTLEWHSPSPPPHDNFPVEPVAGDPYDMKAWTWDEPTKQWVLDEERAKTVAGTEPTKHHH
ncbi:MAG TPA: cbb3-type cytochrome c oxidase subunit I [Tepidisphaeraceae bacterium]|jgi:cytochrome c oxidase subunit 1